MIPKRKLRISYVSIEKVNDYERELVFSNERLFFNRIQSNFGSYEILFVPKESIFLLYFGVKSPIPTANVAKFSSIYRLNQNILLSSNEN